MSLHAPFLPAHVPDLARYSIITGGSSGIGFEVARILLERGGRVILVARNPDKLLNAKHALGPGSADSVDFIACDVRDRARLVPLLEDIIKLSGSPEWVVTCAGIAVPGRFIEQPLEDHENQMMTNYLGTLNVVHTVCPHMVRAGRGRIVLVSSAVALGNFYGYAAYAPSKYALRGLAGTLSLELEGTGVHVMTAFPPDTKTPQLEAERQRRPAITEAFAADNDVLPAESVARDIIAAALKGRREVAPGRGANLLHRGGRLVSSLLDRQQRNLIKKAIAGKGA